MIVTKDDPMDAPLYQCHKQVRALKIKEVKFSPQVGNTIVPEGEYQEFFVTDEYIAKHHPEVGGYWVQYEDDYQSYSPAKAFEDGYTELNAGEPPMKWTGLTEEQEPKYKVERFTGRLVNRATGKPIPPNEPIFILRAQDAMAPLAIANYITSIEGRSPPANSFICTRRLHEFIAWQTDNKDKVKNPD